MYWGLPDRITQAATWRPEGSRKRAWLSATRAPVRCVATAELDLVGLGTRAPHRDADAILRGLKRHP
jgi:hypothetical protein